MFKLRMESVTVESLISGVFGFAAELPDFIPKYGTQVAYGGYSGHKPSAKHVVITNVINCNAYFSNMSEYCVYYTYEKPENGGFISASFYVEKGFILNKLTGLKGRGIVRKFKEHKIKNFHNNIGYAGKVGSDPELFVEDGEGKIIPAFDFLGSKTACKHTTFQGQKLYWDGFQAEFETKADTCLSYHVDSVRHGLKAALDAAKAFKKDAKLSTKPVVMVDHEMLANTKDEHVALGCMPSYNAYGHSGLAVENPKELTVRSAGGHIHFGIGETTEKNALPMVKALDKILGVACVAMFQNFDLPARRQYYGLAGEFRLPKHGLEYRVLSNAWLVHPLIMNLVFDVGRKALAIGKNGLIEVWDATEEETIKCINNCDVKLAQEILTRNKTVFLKILTACYGMHNPTDIQLNALFNIFYKGMEVAIQTTDISKNWKLEDSWTSHNEDGQKKVYKAIASLGVGDKVA